MTNENHLQELILSGPFAKEVNTAHTHAAAKPLSYRSAAPITQESQPKDRFHLGPGLPSTPGNVMLA